MDQHFRMQLQVVIVPGWAAARGWGTMLPSQSAGRGVLRPLSHLNKVSPRDRATGGKSSYRMTCKGSAQPGPAPAELWAVWQDPGTPHHHKRFGELRNVSCPLQRKGRARECQAQTLPHVYLVKASSNTSRGPEKPMTRSGWAPSREKRIPKTEVEIISSETPMRPSVFSPGKENKV